MEETPEAQGERDKENVKTTHRVEEGFEPPILEV